MKFAFTSRIRIIEIQSTFTVDAIADFVQLDVPSTLQLSYPVALQDGLIIYPSSAGNSSGTVTKGPASVYFNRQVLTDRSK